MRGRKPLNRRRVRLHILIDEDLAQLLDLELFDPHRLQTGYGAKSALINRLLREHFNRKEKRDENRQP